MNIAAYCRVSTDKEDQLNSLETQKEFFGEYCNRTGDRLVNVYADEGISGTKTRNRTAFLQMMGDAEEGLFEAVVVKDISRLARNTVDLLQSVRRLKALGIETIFLTANMTSMGNSEFVLTIFGALAQEESANTSKRVKFGKRMNAEKGRVPNIVFGYDKIAGEYFSLRKNEAEAEWIRQIYRWYTKEGYGVAVISKMLNDKGVLTKRGCQWSGNAVARILKNRLYIGEVINGRQEVADFLTGQRKETPEEEWIVVKRPELKIIDSELFDEAQRIMSSRHDAFKLDNERHSNKYTFSTLIKCKECGWSYTRQVKTYKNTYVRWICSGHSMRKVSECSNMAKIEEVELINVLEKYFKDLLSHEKDVKQQVIREFNKIYKLNGSDVCSEKELKGKKTKLERKKSKYMDMYADELISRDELNAKLKDLNKDLNYIENELKLLTKNMSKSDALEKVLEDTFKDIESMVNVREMTNAEIKQIVDKIEIDHDGNVEIYMKPLKKIGLKYPVTIEQKRVNLELPKGKKNSRIRIQPPVANPKADETETFHDCYDYM
ncbi:MAG: recombinase family protein, partial [Anaerovoracaceae bacterium]